VAREAYDMALLAPMFIIMSFSYGLAVFILVLLAAYHWTDRPLGNAILYRLVLPAGRLILAQMPNSGAIQIRHPGESVRLGWSRTDGIILTD